jgi:hypothetical protein
MAADSHQSLASRPTHAVQIALDGRQLIAFVHEHGQPQVCSTSPLAALGGLDRRIAERVLDGRTNRGIATRL